MQQRIRRLSEALVSAGGGWNHHWQYNLQNEYKARNSDCWQQQQLKRECRQRPAPFRGEVAPECVERLEKNSRSSEEPNGLVTHQGSDYSHPDPQSTKH
jgi:hypothetical protein